MAGGDLRKLLKNRKKSPEIMELPEPRPLKISRDDLRSRLNARNRRSPSPPGIDSLPSPVKTEKSKPSLSPGRGKEESCEGGSIRKRTRSRDSRSGTMKDLRNRMKNRSQDKIEFNKICEDIIEFAEDESKKIELTTGGIPSPKPLRAPVTEVSPSKDTNETTKEDGLAIENSVPVVMTTNRKCNVRNIWRPPSKINNIDLRASGPSTIAPLESQVNYIPQNDAFLGYTPNSNIHYGLPVSPPNESYNYPSLVPPYSTIVPAVPPNYIDYQQPVEVVQNKDSEEWERKVSQFLKKSQDTERKQKIKFIKDPEEKLLRDKLPSDPDNNYSKRFPSHRPSFEDIYRRENINKPLLKFFCEWVTDRNLHISHADDFMLTWRLARHNETSLRDLVLREKPASRNQLRLILAEELTHLRSSSIPTQISVGELLDVTLDYFVYDSKQRSRKDFKETPSQMSTLQSALQTINEIEQYKALIQQFKDYHAVDNGVEFEGRLKSLEGLRSDVERKMAFKKKERIQPFSKNHYVSLAAQYILAHLGVNSYTLQRMFQTYGAKFLEEHVNEKFSPFMEYIPKEVSSVIPLISEHFLDRGNK